MKDVIRVLRSNKEKPGRRERRGDGKLFDSSTWTLSTGWARSVLRLSPTVRPYYRVKDTVDHGVGPMTDDRKRRVVTRDLSRDTCSGRYLTEEIR